MHPTLTPEQRQMLDDAVILCLQSVLPGVTVKLDTITSFVIGALAGKLNTNRYDAYSWCGAATQRLKGSGRIVLVRGKGAGWRLP